MDRQSGRAALILFEHLREKFLKKYLTNFFLYVIINLSKEKKERKEGKMSLKRETPCDFGPCPYDAEYSTHCEHWCGADEPKDYPEEDYELGYDPYLGCFTDDC